MIRNSIAIPVLLLASACGAKTGLLVPTCEDDVECCEERCNGLDDDCDGAVDDGLACFFLDGEPIEAQETERCGAEWYAYGTPDAESANPTPDIRIPDGTVVAIQWAPHCPGASVAVITDVPMDDSAGQLNASFTISPPDAAGLLVSDDPGIPDRRMVECSYDAASGAGSCDWTWMPCCTDGVLLGTFTEGCVRMTLSDAMGVSPPVVLDGPEPIVRSYGVPFELCTQIRPAVP